MDSATTSPSINESQSPLDHTCIVATQTAASVLQQLRTSLTALEDDLVRDGIASREVIALQERLAAIQDKLTYAALHHRTRWRMSAWASVRFPSAYIQQLARRLVEGKHSDVNGSLQVDRGLYRDALILASRLEATLQHRPGDGTEIYVKTFSGRTITVRIDALATIQDLKQVLHNREEGPPPDEAMLVHKVKEPDARILAELGLPFDCTLWMLFPCRWRGIRTHGG